VSLEAPISAEKSCTQTFEDVLNSGRENGADWDVRYEQAFKAMVAQVEKDFFSEAARLWEDYVVMKELDCDIADVARKHNISTNCAESLIRRINHSLAARFIPNRVA
jgi:hypothetical protein